jgi:hypothetical protein
VDFERALNKIGAQCLPYPEKGSTIGDAIALFEKEITALPDAIAQANKNFLVYCLVGVLKMLQGHAKCRHIDGLGIIMTSCDASILDEVPDDIVKLSARIVKRWWSSYGLSYVTKAFRVESEVRLLFPYYDIHELVVYFVCVLWCREKAVVEVRLKLLMTWLVLRHVPTMTTSYRKGTPRLIGALLEIKVMALLVILLRVTQNLLKAMTMRCDEGFSVLRCNRRFGLPII